MTSNKLGTRPSSQIWANSIPADRAVPRIVIESQRTTPHPLLPPQGGGEGGEPRQGQQTEKSQRQIEKQIGDQIALVRPVLQRIKKQRQDALRQIARPEVEGIKRP